MSDCIFCMLAGGEIPTATLYEDDDFRVILEIFVMLDDPDLSDADKTEALLRMFYVNHPSEAELALQAFTV